MAGAHIQEQDVHIRAELFSQVAFKLLANSDSMIFFFENSKGFLKVRSFQKNTRETTMG